MGRSSDPVTGTSSPRGENVTADKTLRALVDEVWESELRESPTFASSIGDRRYDDRWPDLSFAAFERRHVKDRDVLARVRAIPRGSLSPEAQLDYDLFENRIATDVEGHAFKLWLLPVNQRSGLQTTAELSDGLPFETVKHYEDWLARIRAFPAYALQITELMREGAKTKVVHPRVVMQRVPAQVARQIVSDPEESPFFRPFKKLHATRIPERERARLAQAAKQLIESNVVPAYKAFAEFLDREYLPACLEGPGAWRLPRGRDAYAFLARLHTTTPLTPQQIHDLGQREVARIRGEMEKVMERAAFTGTLHEFFTFLRTDPRFFHKNKEDLFRAYAETAKKIDPRLVKMFRKLPRTPYGVEAIPDAVAPDTTTAYYREPAQDGSRAGTYFVNLYKPEARPTWEMMALSIHEAVPGHHLQIALAMEQKDLPAFRRHAEYTAYVEGWALYAESLGDEMGLYDDPYSKFGQLAYEMWRAVRLVVDTGMHALEWDRDKAIAFFMDNAPKTELDVKNEIDRYIAWPGQALAYKIGELEIKKLRRLAEGALGPRFDVREFHDFVLEAGALPLQILERRVVAWVEAKRRKP
jgi:uncharacterized protein (DUF885 family)